MNKISLAVFICALIVAPVSFAAGALFSDISEDDWYFESIEKLETMSVITGYSDGTFRPGNNINRAEMAVIIDRFADVVRNSCVHENKVYLEGDIVDMGTYGCACYDGEIKYCTGDLD